jgi:hypothetical protein
MANKLKFGKGIWGVKEGSTLAYNDENGNFKPLPFTFDRSTSATRVNKEGLIEVVGNNEPRIDFLNDSKGALKLEPSRSNNIILSNGFDDASWGKSNSTISTYNLGVGGSTDAWELNATSAGGYISRSVSSNGTQVYSIYAKAGTLNFLRLRVTGSANPSCFFDLVNGTIHNNDGIDASMEKMDNGWWRCIYSLTSNVTTALIYPADTSGSVSSTGSIYIQYSQLEQGSYATSYIPTQGSIGTRVAESCEQTPPSGIIGQTEGSVFLEIKAPNKLAQGGKTILLIGSNPNVVYISKDSSTKNTFQLATHSPSGFNFITTSEITTDTIKFAIGYKNGDNAFYVNGVLVSSISSTTNPSVLSRILLGDETPSTNTEIKINNLKLYNTRLSNAQLQSLTKI